MYSGIWAAHTASGSISKEDIILAQRLQGCHGVDRTPLLKRRGLAGEGSELSKAWQIGHKQVQGVLTEEGPALTSQAWSHLNRALATRR
jgi:hypothetical protein